jgi:hypothetical protein
VNLAPESIHKRVPAHAGKTVATGISRAAGKCFFWYFSLRQRKVHTKNTLLKIQKKE